MTDSRWESHGLGRGLHLSSSNGEASGSDVTSGGSVGGAGFGRGLQTLYSTPSTEEKRRRQLEYARLLKEQMMQSGGQKRQHGSRSHSGPGVTVNGPSATSLQLSHDEKGTATCRAPSCHASHRT